jgi:L,D-peptidoglycan transpeptidase YkuD (ErfK/YbiS/YcfS/YnhG family)
MNSYKAEILKNACYTDLVYERINKKLNKKFSKDEIEKMIYEILNETDEKQFQRTGKNIYVTSHERNIRITINYNTCRIITVNKL